MTELELKGRGVSASRRKFIWLGGGIAASLLFFPEFSLAAKISKAVKRVGAGKPSKPASASSRAASATKTKSTAAKSKSAAAGASKRSRRATTTASKSAAKRSAATSAKGRGGSAARHARAARGRSGATARAGVADPAAGLELPSSYAPGRAFSFGAGSPESRDLSLYCVHTGERLNVDYYVSGRYEPDALRAIDHLLRDYHNDEICQFDPRVLNQLFDLRRALGSNESFHVFSGYRSPTTNESYRRAGGRVAEHSYHLTGQAIDIQLPGRDIRQLRNVALAMRSGGVGYYPSDGFVHLDSGPVRRW